MKNLWTIPACILLCGGLAAAQCLSPGGAAATVVLKSTGNAALDAKFNAEGNRLYATFGINPNMFLFDDGRSPNAFASPQNTLNGYTGSVYFGVTLLRSELWSMSKGEAAVAGIMAHEFAHILQVSRGLDAPSRTRELQADYLAGYYLGKKGLIGQLSLPAFAESLFEKGDYQFRSPSHHGTPAERVAAMKAGFDDSGSTLGDAYDNGLAFVNGGTANDGGGGAAKEPVYRTEVRACTHPEHPNGDFIACTHGPAHPNGDLVPCTHVCNYYGQPVACHQADVVPCSHPFHPGGDVIACQHPLHPQGDVIKIPLD